MKNPVDKELELHLQNRFQFCRVHCNLNLDTKIGQARTVLNAYVKANNATQSLWDSVSVGRIPNPLPVRHASNDFVDALANKEQVNPLEVLSLGEVDNPLNSHVLDTTMYSLMIGKEVGLSNVQLADLSMASFFHDVGFAVNPDEVVPWKSGNVALSHTRIGLRFLSKQQGFQDSKVKRLLAVVEHHMDAYQPEKSEFSPSLFSRVLRVADVFSRLTKPLSELQQALSPPHALASAVPVARAAMVMAQRKHPTTPPTKTGW